MKSFAIVLIVTLSFINFMCDADEVYIFDKQENGNYNKSIYPDGGGTHDIYAILKTSKGKQYYDITGTIRLPSGHLTNYIVKYISDFKSLNVISVAEAELLPAYPPSDKAICSST